MHKVLQGLKPEKLWEIFDQIRQIPRSSKKEEKISQFLVEFAKKHNLEYKQDDLGNVVIKKPASKGMEKKPTVVLQAHMDMVCEKNSDKKFNFDTDPIELVRDGDWIKADGTTLGADNGIGLAAALAVVIDPGVKTGPIEVLATVDEETGLTGAFGLKEDFISGKILLNLDSEEEGEFVIGCAGGKDTNITFKAKTIDTMYDGYEIKVSGLKGGHSGMDINTGRANSIKLLAGMLFDLSKSNEFVIKEFKAGNKRNAIPREATAVIGMAKCSDEIVKILENSFEKAKQYYKNTDPDLALEITYKENVGSCLSVEDSNRILNLLVSLPHGVIAMSQAIEGLVETSTNLAIIDVRDGNVEISEMSRSSADYGIESVVNQIVANAKLANAEYSHSSEYPGWQPDPESNIVKLVAKVYEELFNKKPEIKAIHAGLETGIIGKKFEGMDMVSFGPTIQNPHSPDERVNIPSVEKFWTLLLTVLEKV